MRNYNKLVIVGNVGSDPKVSTFGDDQKVANFSVATNNRFTDKEGVLQERTQWHRVVAFGNLAGIVEKTTVKGSVVLCEGPIEYREYETTDGEKRQVSELRLREFLVYPSGSTAVSPNGELIEENVEIQVEVKDDLPF